MHNCWLHGNVLANKQRQKLVGFWELNSTNPGVWAVLWYRDAQSKVNTQINTKQIIHRTRCSAACLSCRIFNTDPMIAFLRLKRESLVPAFVRNLRSSGDQTNDLPFVVWFGDQEAVVSWRSVRRIQCEPSFGKIRHWKARCSADNNLSFWSLPDPESQTPPENLSPCTTPTHANQVHQFLGGRAIWWEWVVFGFAGEMM